MKNLPTRVRPIVAAALLASGSMLAIADPAPVLALGETLTVTGTVDAAPTPCTDNGGGAWDCDNLRSAIAHANGNGNEATAYDKIILANGSTHTLTVGDAGSTEAIDALDNSVGDLDITAPLTIETADNTLARATIEGDTGFNDRLLQINAITGLTNLVLTKGQGVHMNGGAIYAGDLGNTTITNSLIHGNFASWDQVDGTGEAQGSGGGIYSKGPLNINLSTLSNNTAWTIRAADSVKIGNGGAIYASQATTIVGSTIGGDTEPNPAGGSVGTNYGNLAINGAGIQMAGGNKLEVLRSTFSFNYAVSGGAINVVSPSASPFTVTNSTISGNHVTDSGAGINTNASVYILNTTIANNLKDSGNKGSGINLVGGTATLKNTLLSGNLGSGGVSANCGKVGSGTLNIQTQGGNLSTDATCNLTYSTDQQSVADALLGPLALNDNTLNGTWTHALLTGSPAIDEGENNGCPTIDQRGYIRPFDALVPGTAVCDVGAYEVYVERADLSILSVAAVPDRQAVPYDSTISVVLRNGLGGAAATGVELVTTLPGGVSYVSGSAGCSAVGSTVTCTVADMAAGTMTTVNMTVNVSSPGSNVLTTEVSANEVDLYPTNNTTTINLVGLTVTDLNVTATDVTFGAGSQGTVSYTVTNQGSAVAKNVILSGSAPAGLTVVSTSDAGICTTSSGSFNCTIPELLASGSGSNTRTISVTVASATAGVYTLAGNVTGDVIDGDSSDNSAAATVTVAATGGGGGGCAMGNGESPFDPTLPLLAAAGLMALGLRRTRRG